MGCPLILAARLLASGDANSVPGAGSRGTSGGGLELRPSSSGSMLPCFLPPHAHSAGGLLPSQCLRPHSFRLPPRCGGAPPLRRWSGGRRAWRGRRVLPGAVRRRPPPVKVKATTRRRRRRGVASTTPSTGVRWLGRRQQTRGGAGEG
jgi:hypothetical protein